MFNNTIFTFLFFLFSFHSLPFHEFHLSKSEIKYVQSLDQVQISVHIFIDDLEASLKDQGIDSLYIGTEKEAKLADQVIADYIDDHLQVNTMSDTYEARYVGKELSEDLIAIWCHLAIDSIGQCEDMVIKNDILLEKFEDQKNIVAFSTESGNKDYFIFDLVDQEKKFSCE